MYSYRMALVISSMALLAGGILDGSSGRAAIIGPELAPNCKPLELATVVAGMPDEMNGVDSLDYPPTGLATLVYGTGISGLYVDNIVRDPDDADDDAAMAFDPPGDEVASDEAAGDNQTPDGR